MDNGFTGLGVDNAWQYRRTVANRTHAAAPLTDVGSNRL